MELSVSAVPIVIFHCLIRVTGCPQYRPCLIKGEPRNNPCSLILVRLPLEYRGGLYTRGNRVARHITVNRLGK
jgi:hypothetical protein